VAVGGGGGSRPVIGRRMVATEAVDTATAKSTGGNAGDGRGAYRAKHLVCTRAKARAGASAATKYTFSFT
jgi:hypothetical protein